MGRYGTYEELMAAHPDVVEGLRKRLVWGAKRNEETGCLEWQGAIGNEGYGLVWALARVWSVHRLTWMLGKGEIPAGHLICHHCDNRRCGEIEHLFLGTRADNVGDMRTKERHVKGRGATEEQKARICEMRKAGATLREIAAEVGRTPGTIWKICQDLGCAPAVPGVGLRRKDYRTWQPEWTEQALRMQMEGKRLREIAAQFGVTPSTVYTYIGSKRARGVEKRRPEWAGQALRMQEAGATLREIGERFGVSLSAVYQCIGSKRARRQEEEDDDPLGLLGGRNVDKDFDFGS